MSIALLELATEALEELLDTVVFVGAATIELWITDPAAPPIRPTNDVDVVAEVTTRPDFYRFEDKLRALGFLNDQSSSVICRWRQKQSGLIIDAMPVDASILGFTNRWQAAALPHAIRVELPSGAGLRAISPPYLLATKLEAFTGRGNGDFLGSRDFADIISLIDGREELIEEIQNSERGLCDYIAGEFKKHMKSARFLDGLYGSLPPDSLSQRRAETVILPRINALL